MQESMDAMFRGMIGSLRGRNRKELTRCVELIEDHIFKRPDWIELYFMKYDNNQGYKDFLNQVSFQISEGAVFNHCDLWSPQILWRNGEISGIVDWAMVRPHSLVGWRYQRYEFSTKLNGDLENEQIFLFFISSEIYFRPPICTEFSPLVVPLM